MVRYLTVFFLLVFFSFQSTAQDELTFQLITPPGNNLSIDESLRAIITNRNDEPLEIYLKGTVRESQDGIIFEGTSSVITLPEGSENLNRRNIDNLEPFETRFLGSDYEDYVLRTSEFPPGEYEVCVQVILAQEERVIAEACYEKTIEDFLPPSLISPENRTKVSKSNPFFSWSPVAGNNAGNITYAITIVEITGNQSAISAFQSNPSWFKQDNIRSPLFQYPIQARKLKSEQPYAWKITAYNGDNKISESEVWSFVHVREEQEDSEEEDEEEEEEEILIPDQYVSLHSNVYNAGYYLLNDYQLRFVYDNNYATAHIRCHLKNEDNDIIAQDILNREQRTGLNFNVLDMTNRVQAGKKYYLRCTDPLGNDKGLQFRVRKESTDNTFENIELDGDVFDGLPEGIFDGGG